MEQELKKGNVCFRKRVLMDLICLITAIEGEKVQVRLIDAPSTEVEWVGREEIVKLAEEQNLLLPPDVNAAIEKQREFLFTPPKKKGVRKLSDRAQLKLFKGMKESTLSSILEMLSREQEKEAGEGEVEDDSGTNSGGDN